jgi:hypothetical protein
VTDSGGPTDRGPIHGALDAVWTELAASPKPLPRNRLRSLLGEISVVARREKMQPEQLIITIKESWAEQSAFAAADRQEATRTLSDVVSVCISEFFREEPPDSTKG